MTDEQFNAVNAVLQQLVHQAFFGTNREMRECLKEYSRLKHVEFEKLGISEKEYSEELIRRGFPAVHQPKPEGEIHL